MIVACGVCVHWIVWTVFPPATPWAFVFAAWFWCLALLARWGGARLGVPGIVVATLLVLAAAFVGTSGLGPLPALLFVPACLIGSVAALRRTFERPIVRHAARALPAMALLALALLWVQATRAAARLSPADRVLKVESSPATSIEMRRVPRGDCASLSAVAAGARSFRLAELANRRLAAECPSAERDGAPPFSR